MGQRHMAGEALRELWQLWSGALSDEQVAQIISNGEKQAPVQAEIQAEGNVQTEVRTSTVRWLEDFGLRDMLFEYVKAANVRAFNVDVWNSAEIQFTEYHGTENGHYDWHYDVHWDGKTNSDRKISITVQLSDPSEYEGGNFEFRDCETPEAKTKGSVLVFPSHLEHRVLPVTSGIRKSFVAWFYGPRWR